MRCSPALLRRRSRTASLAILGLLAGVLAVLAPAVPIVSAPAASASSAYLCMGYTSCANAGYSNDGYAAVSGRMYWRMYSGHNCTNYVAYRMIRAGMSPERPFSGSGNAYNWGLARRDITDQRPAVGAVAWWNRNVPGAGSVGHVAYVEKVVSSTVIIVSQDSWGGDFSWKRIDKSDSGWPSGFIHFRDRATFANVTPPSVVGSPQVGVPMRAVGARWKPRPQRVATQWFANGEPVAGATGTSFTPSVAEFGKRIAFRIVASRDGSPPVTARSRPTARVAPGQIVSTTPPAITGESMVGETLRVSRGLYRQRVTRSRAWFADGVAIPGATDTTFTVTRSTVGKTITVQERAWTKGYATSSVASAATAPVLMGAIEAVDPVVGSGEPSHGATLSVDPGTSRPAATTVVYRWLRDGVVVPGAASPTYQLGDGDVGHLVTARVVRTRPNYAPLRTDYAFGTPVTTTSSLRVGVSGWRRTAGVRIHVSAPGVDQPGGPVRVRVGSTVVDGVVRDGYVRFQFDGLDPGSRYVRVAYEGSDVIGRSVWVGKVTVDR